jgi:ketosteroid isomerase-like protein
MSRYRSAALTATLLLAVACQASPSFTDEQRAQVAREVRAAVDSSIAAWNRADAGVFLDQVSGIEVYAENTTVQLSADSVASGVRAFVAGIRSLNLEWRNPVVVGLGPDAGAFSSAFHQTLTDTTGATSSVDGVWTGIYRRTADGWKLALVHESYPMPGAAEGM